MEIKMQGKLSSNQFLPEERKGDPKQLRAEKNQHKKEIKIEAKIYKARLEKQAEMIHDYKFLKDKQNLEMARLRKLKSNKLNNQRGDISINSWEY